MATASKKEIIQKMEALKEGERLSLRFGETYGGSGDHRAQSVQGEKAEDVPDEVGRQ